MKRAAQPTLSVEGQHALDYYAQALKQIEDLSAVTIRNYLSDLRQFIAWCECYFRAERDGQPFMPQTVAPPLLIRYRTYLQTTLWLKPSTVNRTLMSLKPYFAWAVRTHLIRHDPTSTVKVVPKEAAVPRHLSDEDESALVAAVNATGALRDRTIITLLLYTGLRTRELCTLTRELHTWLM